MVQARQLLMGRNLRTTLPVTPDQLKPLWPNLADLQVKEEEYKMKQSQNFNSYHRAKYLPELLPGTKVWLTDQRKAGTVVKKADEPRPYVVKTESSPGGIRRNRRHLVANPNHKSNNDYQPPSLDVECAAPDASPSCATGFSPITTRSGCVVVQPNRLDL